MFFCLVGYSVLFGKCGASWVLGWPTLFFFSLSLSLAHSQNVPSSSTRAGSHTVELWCESGTVGQTLVQPPEVLPAFWPTQTQKPVVFSPQTQLMTTNLLPASEILDLGHAIPGWVQCLVPSVIVHCGTGVAP